MSINLFFVMILSGLMMIFFLFKPLEIKQQEFIDVPVFSLANFTLYELNKESLRTFMSGSEAIRYSNRYTVSDINYSDNSKKYMLNIRADEGIYKGDNIDLSGNVVYNREDGLTFKTQKVSYDKVTTIAHTKGAYVAHWGKDTVKGASLHYNNALNQIDSTKVEAKYQLKGKY